MTDACLENITRTGDITLSEVLALGICWTFSTDTRYSVLSSDCSQCSVDLFQCVEERVRLCHDLLGGAIIHGNPILACKVPRILAAVSALSSGGSSSSPGQGSINSRHVSSIIPMIFLCVCTALSAVTLANASKGSCSILVITPLRISLLSSEVPALVYFLLSISRACSIAFWISVM